MIMFMALDRFRCLFLLLFTATLLVLMGPGLAGAITPDQVDDFQSSATQDWMGAAPSFPLQSGPGGAGDTSLLISADGSGPNGRLLARTTASRWSGDYTSAGIMEITTDVNNFGQPYVLRAAVNGVGGTFSATTGIAVPASLAWQTVTLPLDFVSVSGAACCTTGFDLDATLAAVSELRILHNNVPSWRGAMIVGNLGLDNITAVAAALAGDFDKNTLFDLADLELMYRQGDLRAGVSAASRDLFNLNGDAVIDFQDITKWLELAGQNNGYSSTHLRGDTDDIGSLFPVRRDVDITDFNVLAVSFDAVGDGDPTNGPFWSEGNFDGDDDVDITDFNFLATNFADSGYGSSASLVPEPQTWVLAFLSLSCLLMARRFSLFS